MYPSNRFTDFRELMIGVVSLILSGCGGGDGGGAGTSTPPPPTTAVVLTEPKLSAGSGYSLLTKADGTVWGWGTNTSAQIGIGSTADIPLPVQVTGLSDTIGIAAGEVRSAALRSDGTVWVWGDNIRGYLGTSSTDVCTASGGSFTFACAKTPVQIKELSAARAIAGGASYLAAVKSDGTVWGWGDLYSGGTIGNGIAATPNTTPRQVSGLQSIQSVAVGSGHALALRNDATVWGWGYNLYGQLGTPVIGAALPQQVVGLIDVTAIAAGGYQSLALKKDGRVWAWGSNGLQSGSSVATDLDLSGVSAITAGDRHAAVLKTDGTVWAWGSNSYGQVGNGNTSDVVAPIEVTGLTGVVAISAGTTHTLALKSDGSVWAWGNVDPKSVSSIDKCTFTHFDTHGTSPTGKTIVSDLPCAKRPVKVLFPAT